MKNHIYVIISVFLWGMSQFLLDRLILIFTPTLLIFLRFLFSGILLTLTSRHTARKPFHWKYILTGGLGAFGYYILMTYALSLSSVAFTAIMGGVLPVLAILFDWVIVKKKPYNTQIAGAGIALIGILLFSFEADFKWNIVSAILIIIANIAWLCYGYLKTKWNIGEDSSVLSYEFISTALLSIVFFPTFKILGPVTRTHIFELIAVIFLATILPYKFYLKGSVNLQLSTASMYLNLLPITSLIPLCVMGTLSLNNLQSAGMCTLLLSALIGNLKTREVTLI